MAIRALGAARADRLVQLSACQRLAGVARRIAQCACSFQGTPMSPMKRHDETVREKAGPPLAVARIRMTSSAARSHQDDHVFHRSRLDVCAKRFMERRRCRRHNTHRDGNSFRSHRLRERFAAVSVSVRWLRMLAAQPDHSPGARPTTLRRPPCFAFLDSSFSVPCSPHAVRT